MLPSKQRRQPVAYVVGIMPQNTPVIARTSLLTIQASKVRKNEFSENRRRGKTSYFLRKQRKARRVFCVILFYILGIYREIEIA